jgi:hypothetical protein
MPPVSIRVDVPYAPGAARMRVEVIALEPLKLIRSSTAADLQTALHEVETAAPLPSSGLPVLVCPHDDRHDVAWVVKEEADKRGWGFSRHVEGLLQIPPDRETAYESFDTGSPEDTLAPRDAQVLIMQLGDQARELFGTGMDLLPAMSVMRHSLWLALRYFGWRSPGTALTLRNLGYILRATGNQDNADEFIYLMRRLQFIWKTSPPDPSDWEQSRPLVDQLAEILQALGEPADSLKLPG